VPYWWPRYLMLDIISEPIFVTESGIQLKNPHIIDITTNPNEDEPTFTVSDQNGGITQAKIVDFKFWLLEPNVGIGLWPNYWKRELVRCQQNKNANLDHVGVSDRVVLGNFLKAGHEFLRVKSKTNDLRTGKQNQAAQAEIGTKENLNVKPPSALAAELYTALHLARVKYSLVTVGASQVSLWLVEALKLVILKEYDEVNENIEQVYERILEILKSVTAEDIEYCIYMDSVIFFCFNLFIWVYF
jgi:hypothetical protein